MNQSGYPCLTRTATEHSLDRRSFDRTSVCSVLISAGDIEFIPKAMADSASGSQKRGKPACQRSILGIAEWWNYKLKTRHVSFMMDRQRLMSFTSICQSQSEIATDLTACMTSRARVLLFSARTSFQQTRKKTMCRIFIVYCCKLFHLLFEHVNL